MCWYRYCEIFGFTGKLQSLVCDIAVDSAEFSENRDVGVVAEGVEDWILMPEVVDILGGEIVVFTVGNCPPVE